MLGGLVHLGHGFTDLCHAKRLFVAGRADLAHDVGHALDAAHHLGHGGAGLVDQRGAMFHTLDAGVDQPLDFLGGIRRTARKRPNLTRHNREATALFAGTGSFYGGIERQNVGLKRDAINHADDV